MGAAVMDNKISLFIRHLFSVLLLALAAGVSLVTLGGCSGNGGGSDGSASLCNIPFEANLDSQVRIGGATTTIALHDETATWTLYNVANELRATPVGTVAGEVFSLAAPGYIQDIHVVEYGGVRYALLAMGSEGIAVVNVNMPSSMQLVRSVQVNYFQGGLIWTEGGGDIIGDDEPANEISSVRAPVTALEVFDPDPDAADNPLQLLIADEGYGLHKTLLSNLLAPDGPVLDPDGTLLIDDGDPGTLQDEVFTLQYAGENPWGGPKDLKLYGGRLFVAMGYLGMGIFDPVTLEQVGSYNLYTDASVSEDWFIDMDVSDAVQKDGMDPFVDDFTGMPDYRQASFEILDVWKGTFDCSAIALNHCTPWADFDRYGREYYKARAVDVATFGDTTIAYIAYGLGGLIAVDVTGFDTATPPIDPSTGAWGDFLKGKYLGYAPAVPANGPDTPTGTQSASLFPHLGSGMLKEAGVVAVTADVANNTVYYSDHFAGLVVMGGADDPQANWKQAGAPFDNDDPALGDGVLGDHWPDFEFVTSYDMTGADEHETLPAWMRDTAGPDLLATGEVSGHGNALALIPGRITNAGGQVDVLMASGAGGFSFLDIKDLDVSTDAASSFDQLVLFVSTDEIGADADGLPEQPIAIGHTEGVDAFENLLFVADGPHGMSVWQIADENCVPTDEVNLVANTLQDEYDVLNSSGETVTPTPHAYDVVVDPMNQKAMVLSQSLGLRRVGADAGAVGAPLLLKPQFPDDVFEHNVDEGNVVEFIHRQDHAYDVALSGNLAFVADGSNGITVYDLTKVPDYVTLPNAADGHVVSNLGASSRNPLLGRVTAVELWTDADTGIDYALVAAGHAGIGVVDISQVQNASLEPEARMTLVKIFEPIKIEDGKVGHADARSVDVQIVGDHAFFTYDSFGVVVYRLTDLVAPLPDGVDPTDLWRKTPDGVDHRPVAVYRFKLQDPALGGSEDLAGWSGGALGMTAINVDGKDFFYIGYGAAGVVKLDWTDPEAPLLLQHTDTVGEALDVTVVNGRVYVADNMGGIALLK